MLKAITILALIFLKTTHQLDTFRNTAPLVNDKAGINERVARYTDTQLYTEEKRPVPCSRRNLQSNPIDNPDEWLPTYKSRVLKPSTNTNIIKIPNREHLKKDGVVKTEITPHDLIAQKISQHRIGFLLNPQINYKPVRNLLLSNDDRVQSKEELVRHEALSQNDSSRENLLDYSKSNTYEYVPENKKSQSDEMKILVKPEKESQRDRDVIVDSDYTGKLKEVIITEYVQNLSNRSSHENLSTAENHENNNLAYSNRINNYDKENDNCIPEKFDNDGYLKDGNSRRFILGTIDTEDNNLDDNSLENESERKDNYDENEFLDPANGVGIRKMSLSGISLLQHSRVCYACSTVNNPTCWIPDRRTTVKYCRQGHEACVTKTFKSSENKLIVTRDCGDSCDDTDIPGPKYKSCSVCHTDMCNDTPNGAPSLKKEKFIISILTMFIIRCTF